ncbi:DUF4150 domain-containing protein [Pseudoduganella buxea]|uniref:DUF4150 domain-containing protein n=1 Tax=Pseudoduganella buxea TaxID=1949069 RepID=A0A6I3SUQ1_9BURK|nr:DUF4150 domain-containing protein [Pseudoduganella buxea]MTV52395.1 DUF4150 domain-containing protein [Pseudoduganella buxea]GGC17867.1 hypothetical protein GCM10011572_44000 [Pseudoduganella buxea]
METYVYANDNEICSRAADGKSMVAPDPCWSPPAPSAGPVVIPYSNTAYAKNLKEGSATVFVCGTPVALRDVSYLANSTGNEPATRNFAMGVSSHTITGKAYFTAWSPNVKVEGLNVCRHIDPMTHNHA